MYTPNPVLGKQMSVAKARKVIQSEITFREILPSLITAEEVIAYVLEVDPAADRALNYRSFIVQTFIQAARDGSITSWREEKTVNKRYLTVFHRSQMGSKNKSWADFAPLERFKTFGELGAYLVEQGAISSQFSGDWINLALELQLEGHCFILNERKGNKLTPILDREGKKWVFVDLITATASCDLGSNSGWCTAAGAFYNYLPNSGLIMGYCLDDEQRFQITSATDAESLDRYEKDGTFVEQKLPNNVVFKFTGRYAPIKKPLLKLAKMVQLRVSMCGGRPIYDAYVNYVSHGNRWQGEYAKLNKLYEGKCNMPPLFPISQGIDLLKELYSINNKFVKGSKLKSYTQLFTQLSEFIPSNFFLLELCTLRNPVAWKIGVAPYVGMVDIPMDSYIVYGGEMRATVDAFEIMKYEVTSGLFLYIAAEDSMVLKQDILKYQNPGMPISEVSWYDCLRFANALSRFSGLEPCYKIEEGVEDEKYPNVSWNMSADGFRLPTETEWEISALEPPAEHYKGPIRGSWDSEKIIELGEEGEERVPYTLAPSPMPSKENYLQQFYTYAGSNDPNEVAWYSETSQGRAHVVGELKPNGWGLYDMSGNVGEWTYDSQSDSPTAKTSYPLRGRRANRGRR